MMQNSPQETKAPAEQAQAVLDKSGAAIVPGQWNPKDLASFIRSDDIEGSRVLDIGANRGGLSLELARMKGSVVAMEPVVSNGEAQLLAEQEKLDVTWGKKKLFESHELGKFDVIICFGLMYHFRNPHYLLDYLSSLAPKVLYISTQTVPGEEVAIVNRAINLLPERYSMPLGTRGWHTTHPALRRMLEASGFDQIEMVTDREYNYPDKPKGATNSAYYRAECVRPVEDPKALNEMYEARW